MRSPLQSVPNATLVWPGKWQPAITLLKAEDVTQEEKDLSNILIYNTMMEILKARKRVSGTFISYTFA